MLKIRFCNVSYHVEGEGAPTERRSTTVTISSILELAKNLTVFSCFCSVYLCFFFTALFPRLVLCEMESDTNLRLQWHHHSSWGNPHWTSSYDPPDPPYNTVTTIYVNPGPSTITQYVTVTASSSSETARITFYPPRNAEPEAEAEPQVFSLWPAPSRTVQESPTPPLPWWYWWSTPTATPLEIIERKVDEKREPQTLDFGGSRSKQL